MNFDKKIEIAKHHQALQAKKNAHYITAVKLLIVLIQRYPELDSATIKKIIVNLFFESNVKIYKRHSLNGDWTHLSHLTCLELGAKEFVPGLLLIDKQYFEEIFTEAADRLTEPDYFCNIAFNLAEAEKTVGFELTSESPVSGSQELIIKDKRIAELEVQNEKLMLQTKTLPESSANYTKIREEIISVGFTLLLNQRIKIKHSDISKLTAPDITNAIFENANSYWPVNGVPREYDTALNIIRDVFSIGDLKKPVNLEIKRTTPRNKRKTRKKTL
ncbi:hypothetical protein [Klebsiella sp. BIGb0407]|uniref:hypothetical protein n=1 Tax=Klebsiella sp. BIGb0407 TaxID=2940603 RepID=UPI00216A92CB|nr:hypothetical protein [Klebsiella sp. BIGb0407]MCS3430228.1 hypothetical protein [Klebsiella sp. BIGb0407]